jgi:hypothetical protein
MEFWSDSDSYTTDYVLEHILTLSGSDRANRSKNEKLVQFISKLL